MPQNQVTKRLFSRVVLWQRASGAIIDLPSRYVLSTGTPSKSESRSQMADGSVTATSRQYSLEIPLFHEEGRLMSRLFQLSDCAVEASIIGVSGTEHVMWLEPTRAQIDEPSVEAGFSEKVLSLSSSVFHSGIWRGMNLIEGVPWQMTEARQIENQYELRYQGEGYRPGYEGPAFIGDQGATVDMAGSTSNLNEAVLSFRFPVWGAKLRLETLDGYSLSTALILAKSWNESVLASDTEQITLPDETWRVEVRVASTDRRPKVSVVNAGMSEARIYAGQVTPDCSQGEKPPWDPIPEPNEAPVWERREDLVYENEPPAWEEREDLVWDPDNTAPTFILDNYVTSIEESTEGNVAPVIYAGDYVFTSELTGTDEAPTIENSSGISLNVGTKATITDNELKTTDPEDGASDLTYTITSAPSHGEILVGGSQASSFTQEDINTGSVEYDHTGSDDTDDSFGFDVEDSDGNVVSGSFPVSVIEELLGYQEPTIGVTQAVYSSVNNVAKVKWSDKSFLTFSGTDGNGHVAVDYEAGYVFVPFSDGVYRYSLNGANQTEIISATGDGAFGVAVDPLTTTLYVAFNGKSGIYSYGYDGSSSSIVVDDGITGYDLAVAPDGGNGGYLFGASESGEKIKRWQLDGTGEDLIWDSEGETFFHRSNVHLHLATSKVYFQVSDSSKDRRVFRADFSGRNVESLWLEQASVSGPSSRTWWTILQQEEYYVQVESNGRIVRRDLDGSNFNETYYDYDGTIGKYIASSESIT